MTTKKNLTLIDADSLIYVISSCEKGKEILDNEGNVIDIKYPKSPRKIIMKTQSYIANILKNTDADCYMGFYQDDNAETLAEHNFRYGIYPEYKGNRGEAAPFIKHWREVIMQTFKEQFHFIPVTGYESDDAVCFMYHHYKDQYNVTIAANDKDTLQNAGIFYYDTSKNAFGVPNVLKKSKQDKPDYLPKGTKRKITTFEAAQHTAYQLIVGDSTDNIKGIVGAGPAKAKKIIEPCKSILELKKAIVGSYKEYYETQKVKIEKLKFVLDDMLLADIKEKYKTDAAVERQLRMLKRDDNAITLKEMFGGTWKDYFKLQWQLLVMLKDVPEGFNTTLQENPYKVETDEDDLLMI